MCVVFVVYVLCVCVSVVAVCVLYVGCVRAQVFKCITFA